MSNLSPTVRELIEKRKAEAGGYTAPVATPDPEPAAPAKPDPLVDWSAITVLKNTIKYSEIVGEMHPSGTDWEYPKPPVFEQLDAIPEPDENWVPDHGTLPNTIACIMYGHNGLIVGPPGTGKTKDPQEICARAGIPYYRVNGMAGMEASDLVGSVHLVDGDTKFIDGPICEAVESGGLLAIDEPFKMPAGTLMALQALAEETNKQRYISKYGHEDASKVRLYAHPQFRMVLCDNVRGTGDGMDKMAATEIQDQSFINRMTYKILKDYMSPETEVKAICKAYPWITTRLAGEMVKFGNLMRKAWNNGSVELPFSFRELQAWSDAIAETRSIRGGLDVVYGNLLTEDSEKDIYINAWNDVGLTS